MPLSILPSSQINHRHSEAEAALERHDLVTLFTQHLRWKPCAERRLVLTPRLKTQKQCIPIAYRDYEQNSTKYSTAAWKVWLKANTLLTSPLKERLYKDISRIKAEEYLVDWPVPAQPVSAPLVIFVDDAGRRSLWCQASSAQELNAQGLSAQELKAQERSPLSTQSALYVSGQPTLLWNYRLSRLRENGQGLFCLRQTTSPALFESLLEGLHQGITGIGNHIDRQDYALLTLQRLVFIQTIQQKGWIDGDTWYLQTRFEKTTQTQNNFFEACLRRLYRCLSLPSAERPAALSQQIGKVPFLGQWFHTHSIEQKYPGLSIQNQPFEKILGWLSEQTSTDGLNPWVDASLSLCLERHCLDRYSQRYPERHSEKQDKEPGKEEALLATVSLAKTVSDRTLNQLILSRMQTPDSSKFASVSDRLFSADAIAYRHLIQDVLPSLRILDPACGSGSLLAEIYQSITEIFCNLIGCIRQSQDAQMKIWLSGLVEESDSMQDRAIDRRAIDRQSSVNLVQVIQQRILKSSLYGVDISSRAVETTVFQLLLQYVSIATEAFDIEPLVDLNFNILNGNSLVGLIKVDEERFEQVQTDSDDEILQGDLLQPLAADSYQTILSEKNLAVEHYKFRNQMLAEANNIPAYARTALLKEEILRLDINAQQKLDRLLLNQMSQQLGIRYKAAQLDGKPQRRPLAIEDIDILHPFHWGYHFNTILAKGGFDIVVCTPPQGIFKPTAAEFLQKFQDLAAAKGLDGRSLKTSKSALAKGDREVAAAWLFYQSQYAYVADYFYRSERYKHQNAQVDGKTVRNQLSKERLFVEQCFNLLSNRGICAIVLPKSLTEQPKAQMLYQFLQEEGSFVEENIETSHSRGSIAILKKDRRS